MPRDFALVGNRQLKQGLWSDFPERMVNRATMARMRLNVMRSAAPVAASFCGTLVAAGVVLLATTPTHPARYTFLSPAIELRFFPLPFDHRAPRSALRRTRIRE